VQFGASGREVAKDSRVENGRFWRGCAVRPCARTSVARCTNGARPRAYVRSRMAREEKRGGGLPEGAAASLPMSVSQLEIAYRAETSSRILHFPWKPPLPCRHSRVSLAAFRLHSFPRLFRPRTSRPDHVLARRDERAELYTANQFTVPAFGAASPRSEGGL